MERIQYVIAPAEIKALQDASRELRQQSLELRDRARSIQEDAQQRCAEHRRIATSDPRAPR